MDLIFVRHGRPERDDSSADPPLSDLGRQQADRVGQYLAGEPIDHIVASSMARANQTAEPLAQTLRLPVEQRDDIREVNDRWGQYVPSEELGPDSELVRRMQQDPMSLFDDHGGWEPWRQRVDDAVGDIARRNVGKRVAVFCHGMVMATLLCSMIGSDQPLRYLADYTGLFRVKINRAGLRTVVSWNETAHVRDAL